MSKRSDKELNYVEYWDAKYARTDCDQLGSHEWYLKYEDFKDWLEKHLPSSSLDPRILHLGCGTSSATADLYASGYKNQTSIDFSSVAIEAMKEKYAALPSLEWKVMDVRKMDFPSESFDIALDKGTLDLMLYGSLWDPPDEVKANIKAYAEEVARCLKPNGKWLSVGFKQPHFAKPLLEQDGKLSVQAEILGGEQATLGYFGLIMSKSKDS